MSKLKKPEISDKTFVTEISAKMLSLMIG